MNKPTPKPTIIDKGPTAPGSTAVPDDDGALPLPHERDQSTAADSTGGHGSGAAGDDQKRVMDRARRDLAEGQVDTDLRGTPGLDDEKRRELLKKS